MPTMQTSLGTDVLHRRRVGSADSAAARRPARPHRLRPVHDALANGRRVLALDWPGHGASPSPATPLRAVQFGDLAIEFADRLDLSNLVVVGNSVGGYAACRLALERPERIAGVVLVNTGGFTDHSVFTRSICAVMGRPAVYQGGVPAVRPCLHARPGTSADEAVVDRVVGRAKTTDGARTAAALWKSFTEPGHDLRTRAARIAAPVLITWGTKDLTAPRRWGEAVHAAIPGSGSRRCRPDTSCSRPSRRRGWTRCCRSSMPPTACGKTYPR